MHISIDFGWYVLFNHAVGALIDLFISFMHHQKIRFFSDLAKRFPEPTTILRCHEIVRRAREVRESGEQ
jgi:hypothetical protein